MSNKKTDVRDIVIPQLVELAFAVGTLYLLKKMHGPDAFRTLRMRGALLMKRFADNQANMWSAVSTHAATSYQKARL